MKNLLILTLVAITLLGCQSATRTSIKPEEANHHFTIRHHRPAPEAFRSVELTLAETYNDLPRVLKLKQPETGIFLLKPLVPYQVGGALGQTQYARYTLKLVVSDQTVVLDFELGREETSGWDSYAPETEIPKIRANFRAIAANIARTLDGTLE